MNTVEQIASKLGKARIARATGRSPSAVTNALRRGAFPAAWRTIIEELGAEARVEIPSTAFYSIPQAADGGRKPESAA